MQSKSKNLSDCILFSGWMGLQEQFYLKYFWYFLLKFNFAEICWGKFAEAMGSYLTTFACFAAICLVIEVYE